MGKIIKGSELKVHILKRVWEVLESNIPDDEEYPEEMLVIFERMLQGIERENATSTVETILVRVDLHGGAN